MLWTNRNTLSWLSSESRIAVPKLLIVGLQNAVTIGLYPTHRTFVHDQININDNDDGFKKLSGRTFVLLGFVKVSLLFQLSRLVRHDFGTLIHKQIR